MSYDPRLLLAARNVIDKQLLEIDKLKAENKRLKQLTQDSDILGLNRTLLEQNSLLRAKLTELERKK